VIAYRVDRDDEVIRLITTVDPGDADATELARAYHERWEIETSFRELECQLLHPGKTLRGKSPKLIYQEINGLFLTHYAIRSFMAEAADTIEIDPDRMSPIRAINIIRRSITDPPAFSPQNPSTPLSAKSCRPRG
jgi:hypothetical protein